MTNTRFCCTHVFKCATEDSYLHGESNKTVITLDEGCHTTAGSLAELIKKLSDSFYIDIDYVTLPDDDCVEYFTYSRMEDVDGNEPSEEEMGRWRNGQLKLYHAEYRFTIKAETVVAQKLTWSDFKGVVAYDI